jgi:hypothetical protein
MFDPIPAYPIPACRDRSRHPGAKARAMGRRADRVAKSARLFLAFAFPADMRGAV